MPNSVSKRISAGFAVRTVYYMVNIVSVISVIPLPIRIIRIKLTYFNPDVCTCEVKQDFFLSFCVFFLLYLHKAENFLILHSVNIKD